jgi:hypothetical protein
LITKLNVRAGHLRCNQPREPVTDHVYSLNTG